MAEYGKNENGNWKTKDKKTELRKDQEREDQIFGLEDQIPDRPSLRKTNKRHMSY